MNFDLDSVPMPTNPVFAAWLEARNKRNQFVIDVEGLDITFRYATIKDLVSTGVIPTPLLSALADHMVANKPEKSEKEVLVDFLHDIAKSRELYEVVVKNCLISPVEFASVVSMISYESLESIYVKIISGGEGAADLKSSAE